MAKKQDKPLEKDDIVFVNFEVVELPTYSIDKMGKHIKWGKNNDWPSSVINLAENHPVHGPILKTKARYLSGLSIKPEQDSPIVQDFLAHANPKESWYELSKKCNPDKVSYGGAALMVIGNIAGQPLEFHHIDMGKLRRSDCFTGWWYSEEWEQKKHNIEKTFIPDYKDGFVGTSILVYKDHALTLSDIGDAYPKEEYRSCVLDISTDIEISKYKNSFVKNGFSAGHVITFFSGEVKPEVKQDIIRRFQDRHTGADNAGRVVVAFTSKDGKGVEIENIDATNHHNQFAEIYKQHQQNIVISHCIPSVLAKIKTEGGLGNDRNEIDLAQELFINEYAKPEQEQFMALVQKFCKMKTGVDTKFTVEQFNLVDKELPLDNQNVVNALNAVSPQIISDYIIKKYGIKVPEGAVTPQATPQAVAQNEALMNLTGMQRRGLDSVTSRFRSGKYTREQAIMHLKSFGFTDQDAIRYLGMPAEVTQMSAVDKEKFFLEWVKANTVEIDEDDEILEVTYGKPEKKPVQMAEEKKGFFEGLIGRIKEAAKKKSAEDEEYDYEVYTVYKYGLRPDLPANVKAQYAGGLLIPTSHEFCREMVAATSGNKRLTFEKIDSYENDFGDNAFDFRGGWTGVKGESDPRHTCNHIWIGETRTRKIKK